MHLWSYRAEFLEWEMFQTNLLQKIKTQAVFNIFFKIVQFMRYVEKYSTAGQATDDNMVHGHYMLDT